MDKNELRNDDDRRDRRCSVYTTVITESTDAHESTAAAIEALVCSKEPM